MLLEPDAQRADGRPETEAAALAYVLHNEALATLVSQAIDEAEMCARLERLDTSLGTACCDRLRPALRASSGGCGFNPEARSVRWRGVRRADATAAPVN